MPGMWQMLNKYFISIRICVLGTMLSSLHALSHKSLGQVCDVLLSLSYPFFRRGNLGLEKVSDLPKTSANKCINQDSHTSDLALELVLINLCVLHKRADIRTGIDYLDLTINYNLKYQKIFT